MTNSTTAFDSIKESYDLDTLREIRDHGCQSGVANDHIYYHQTVPFYDDNEEEIIEYISNDLDEEYLDELWVKNTRSFKTYKNDVVWCFVECVAHNLLEEFETTMIEYEQEIDDTYGDQLYNMRSLNDHNYAQV